MTYISEDDEFLSAEDWEECYSDEDEGYFTPPEEIENTRRLNVSCYGELLRRLEAILELNKDYEYKYFSLRINYSLLGQRTTIHRVTDARHMNNMRLRDIINCLKEEISQLEERYEVTLTFKDEEEEEDITRNLDYAILKEIMPSFGKGDENYNFVFTLKNKLWTVVFPPTKVKCIVTCVYDLLKVKKTDRFFLHKAYSRMSTEVQLKEIENYFKIKIKIAQTIETLKHDVLTRGERDVILFARDNHVGYVVPGVRTPLDKNRPVPIANFGLKDEIILVGYDCEYGYVGDKPQKPNLVCAVIKVGGRVLEKAFSSFNGFIIYIEELVMANKANVFCYAHNAQKVENIFSLQEIVKFKKMKETTVHNFSGNKIKSHSYTINKTHKFKNGETRVERFRLNFLDTLCFVKAPLDKITTMFALPTNKGHNKWPTNGFTSESELDRWYYEHKWSVKDADDVDYCMKDARIVLELAEKMDAFIKTIFEDEIKTIYKNEVAISDLWTLNKASMASVCRTIFHCLYPEILNRKAEAALFKTMYYGGRNECFFIGSTPLGKDVYTMDVNSHYPNEMRHGFAGNYIYCDTSGKATIKDIVTSKYRWCAYVVLRYATLMKFPLLAVYENGKLLFPNIMSDRLVPIWDVEYEAIKDNLIISSIPYVGFFEECNFSAQIDKLAVIKTTTKDPAMRAFSKIIMNSIYGISGMDSYRPIKSLVKDGLNTDHISSDYVSAEAFDDYIWLLYRKFAAVNSSFQSASSITAQARLCLWKAICFADSKGCKVLYCDTDSIMFLPYDGCDVNTVFKDFLHPTELGKWDLETHKQMVIFTNKVYAYRDDGKDTVKFKGLNGKNLDQVDVDTLASGSTYSVSGTRATRSLAIENYTVDKQFTLRYCKGNVGENGEVTPFVI